MFNAIKRDKNSKRPYQNWKEKLSNSGMVNFYVCRYTRVRRMVRLNLFNI